MGARVCCESPFGTTRYFPGIYPREIDTKAPPAAAGVEAFRELAERLRPNRVVWRDDPIVFTGITPPAFHQENFRRLAEAIRGHARRVVVSTVYRDGKGFGGGSGEGSMSLARILGTPSDITGENIVSATGHKTGGGPGGRKASGLLMVEGVLYMWVRNFKKDGTGSSLAWSKDHGKTWTWADWSFPEIGYPVLMNAGRNYEAAQDGFAYMVSPDTPSAYKTSDHIILARVPKGRITHKEAYEFFAGLDESGKPRWTANFQDRKPVFTDPGHCYRPDVVYNPGLKRYLLCTATSGSPKWCGTDEKYLGVFDAPHPWGPWSVVKQIEGWGGDENRFQPRIPAKWLSPDGRSFYLLYSCFPKGPYKFNVQRCSCGG